jgi:hypothetical protein
MKLQLERTERFPDVTFGKLSIDGAFECYTLEDPVPADGIKVKGHTAIPKGTYPVTITWSPRFQRELPLIGYVPGFSGVRIHAGNTVKDTEGCVLVGQSRDVATGSIGRSQKALAALLPKLDAAVHAGIPISLEITEP